MKILPISNSLLFLFIFFVSSSFAQSTLVRGPYLNSGTPTSMIVQWQTSQAEIGIVKFGIDSNNLSIVRSETAATVNHQINLSGLQPNTYYFYSIGSGNTFYTPESAEFYFKTSPVSGSTQPVRIWVIGDFGNGSQATIDVKNSYLNHFGDTHTDVWLWTGDNAYGSGTQTEYQSKVFEVFPEVFRNTVAWPTPGNHDYGSINISNRGPYYDIFALPENAEAGGVPSNEEAYYSFDYGNVHFLSLNSEYLPAIFSGTGVFFDWLRSDLQQNQLPWVIAYWHQPPYTKGTHDSDDSFSRSEMSRQNINPILEEFGVDLVLNGHSHGYERSFLIKDHFGKSTDFDPSAMIVNGTNGNPDEGNTYFKNLTGAQANEGTVYCVVGCSGQKGSGNDPLNHPAMYFSTETFHGSLVIDVNNLVLSAQFIDTMGNVIDKFAISKEDPTSVPSFYGATDLDLKIFPNPFEEQLSVAATFFRENRLSIEIKDLSGKSVYYKLTDAYSSGTHQFSLNPKNISAGTYLMEVKTSDNRTHFKRLIQKF